MHIFAFRGAWFCIQTDEKTFAYISPAFCDMQCELPLTFCTAAAIQQSAWPRLEHLLPAISVPQSDCNHICSGYSHFLSPLFFPWGCWVSSFLYLRHPDVGNRSTAWTNPTCTLPMKTYLGKRGREDKNPCNRGSVMANRDLCPSLRTISHQDLSAGLQCLTRPQTGREQKPTVAQQPGGRDVRVATCCPCDSIAAPCPSLGRTSGVLCRNR